MGVSLTAGQCLPIGMTLQELPEMRRQEVDTTVQYCQQIAFTHVKCLGQIAKLPCLKRD